MIIKERVIKVKKELIEEYKKVEPATIGHFTNFGFMSSQIKAAFDDIQLVGSAVTVKITPMDSTLCHKALGIAQAGDVIVINRCGDTEYACWGGGLTFAAKIRGIAGVIVDGAVTDIQEIRKMKFPAYYRTITALTTKLLGIDGEINTPVECGGVVVNPGDLIVGDVNGVLVIPPENAERYVQKALELQNEEMNLRRKLEQGELLPHLTGVDELIEKMQKFT